MFATAGEGPGDVCVCVCVCAHVRACVRKYAIILVNLMLLVHAPKMKILFTTVVSPGDE